MGCELATEPVVRTATSQPDPVAYTVSSTGAVWLDPDLGSPIRVEHVRVELEPEDFMTAEIADAELVADGVSMRALAVDADLATLPAVLVDPGQRAVLDLYFPATDAADRELVWTVATGRTSIVIRGELDAIDDVVLGAAEHWWFSPSYPWPTFRHQDGRITSRPPTTARVRRENVVDNVRDLPPPEIECDEW